MRSFYSFFEIFSSRLHVYHPNRHYTFSLLNIINRFCSEFRNDSPTSSSSRRFLSPSSFPPSTAFYTIDPNQDWSLTLSIPWSRVSSAQTSRNRPEPTTIIISRRRRRPMTVVAGKYAIAVFSVEMGIV